MATIGQARIVNLTDKQREFVATTVLPLPDKRLWSDTELNTGSPNVTVTGSLLGGLGTLRCQTHILGQKYPSGMPRYLRVIFKGEIEAGVVDANFPDYSFYKEKIVTFTDAVTAGVAWSVHTQLQSDIPSTKITVNVPYPSGTKTMVFDLMDVLTGVQGFEYDIEGQNPDKSLVKAFYGGSRIWPSNSSEPSFNANLILEIPSDMRQVKFWLTINNSIITDSPQGRYHRTHWILPSDLTVDIDGPTVAIRGESAKLPVAPVAGGGTTTITLIQKSQSGTDPFPDGYSTTIEGVLLYDSGAAGIEADTMTAESDQEKGDLEIISIDWKDDNIYGVIGYVPPRPTNSLIVSDDTGRYQAAKQLNNDWSKLSGDRHPWFAPSYYHVPKSGSGGGSDGFGTIKAWLLACSGQPDFRALKLSSYQESSRWFHWKYPHTLGHLLLTSHTGSSGLDTDIYLWDSRVFFGNAMYKGTLLPPKPPYADEIGLGEGPPPVKPRSNTSQNWDGYDRQHYSNVALPLFYLLTGNRWAYWEINCQIHILLDQLFSDYDTNNQHGSSLTKKNAMRAEGRMLHAVCNMLRVIDLPLGFANGHTDTIKWLNDRLTNVLEKQWTGRWTTLEVRPFGLKKDIQGNPGQFPGVRPWEEGLVAIGLEAAYRYTGNQKWRDIAIVICRNVAMNMARNNSDSGNKWQICQWADWEPYPSKPGTAIKDVDKFDSSKSWRGIEFANWEQTLSQWALPAIALGWEFAIAQGDTKWAERCRDILIDKLPAFSDANRKGTYGWGNAYTNNWDEWLALVDDPWKGRNTNLVEGNIEIKTSTTISALGATIFADGSVNIQTSTTIGAIGSLDNAIKGGVNFTTSTTISADGDATTVQSSVAIKGSTSMDVTGEVVTDKPNISSIVGRVKVVTEILLRKRDFIMTAVDQVFVIWSGDDHVLEVTVIDQDGSKVDLTNTTDIKWTLRNDVGSGALVSKSFGNGIQVLPQDQDDTKGKFRVWILAADTKLLNGKYYHEGEIQVPGFTTTLFEGHGLIQPAALLP